MVEPEYFSRPAQLLDDIVRTVGELYSSEVYSDVVLSCTDGQLSAHRLVIGYRSRLLQEVCKEEDVEIILPDYSIGVVRGVLDLLYKGSVLVNQECSDSISSCLRLLGVDSPPEKQLQQQTKQKLKIKHENNLSSRKLVSDSKQPGRKTRVLTASLDPADLTCDTCFKTFSKVYKLRNHQLIHLTSFPFICSNCGKGFKNKYKLNAHERDHKQGLVPLETPKPGNKNVVEKKVKEKKYFPCRYCGEQFSKGEERSQHISQNHSANHSCFHCATKFRTKKNLIAHLRVVHNDLEGVLRHVCPICDKRFLKPSHLEDHQARHNPVGQHPCMYCPKRCATKQDLDRHLTSHRGEAKLTCQLCFKAFVHRSTYTEHVRKHLGQKPYSCRPCNKTFSQYKTLKHHQKTHEKREDRTVLVVPAKGSRGCHSYIDVITEPTLVNTTQLNQKDLSSQVYIPGPQYTKSTGYKAIQSVTPLKHMQVITDYAEISRIGFNLSDHQTNGFTSAVDLDQIFPSQPVTDNLPDST